MLRESSKVAKAALAGTFVAGLIFIQFVDNRLAGLVLYSVMIVLAVAFIASYALHNNWRITSPGRSIMYVNLLLLAFVVWVTLSFALQDKLPHRDEIRQYVVLCFSIVLLNQLLTLNRYQRIIRRKKAEADATPDI